MPFTEQELQNYQFYLQLKEERDKKYQDFYLSILHLSPSYVLLPNFDKME